MDSHTFPERKYGIKNAPTWYTKKVTFNHCETIQTHYNENMRKLISWKHNADDVWKMYHLNLSLGELLSVSNI